MRYSLAALQIPTLRTNRMRLEPLSVGHSAGMFALWSQEDVCRYAGAALDVEGRPITLPASVAADSDRILTFFVQRAAAGLGFRWAMMRAPDETFIGAVGFNHLGACPELACHLHPDAWGQGLMAEACRAALAWLPDVSQVQAFIDPENRASIRLIQRLGFQATGDVQNAVERYLLRF